MKFVYETLTVQVIERRVREEQQRTNKRVIEVLLSNKEWREFVHNLPTGDSWNHLGGCPFRFYMHESPAAVAYHSSDYCQSEVANVITVRPE